MRVPELVAHRGYARRYPENTLSALEGAVEAGARWVEVDVQLSKDRVPFLLHDRTLERMCGVPSPIHALSAAELARLHASEPGRFGDRFADEPLAPLADLVTLLGRHPGLGAFVEIKRHATERFGNAVVLERTLEALEPVLGRTCLISFAIDFLQHARSSASLRLGPVIESWGDLAEPGVAELAPDVVFADVEILPPGGPLRAGGARLAIYEVDVPRRALELAERGVELIETFAVGEMIAGLDALRRGA